MLQIPNNYSHKKSVSVFVQRKKQDTIVILHVWISVTNFLYSFACRYFQIQIFDKNSITKFVIDFKDVFYYSKKTSTSVLNKDLRPNHSTACPINIDPIHIVPYYI